MIQFIFNLFPISINKLYVNIPGQKRRFISTEGKAFKAEIEEQVKQSLSDKDRLQYISALRDKRLAVIIRIRSASWLLKDGKTIRKKDVSSAEKALTDSIFKAFNELGIMLDDSQIWSIQLIKELTDDGDETLYTIFEYA
jgi:Holliday junction resolvase RusA-like endonuclease